MIKIYDTFCIEHFSAKMLLQLHDELVFEVSQRELYKLRCLVKDIMESVLKLRVPVKVTIKKGKNWLEMSEV
jgi:DNA polymerase-1